MGQAVSHDVTMRRVSVTIVAVENREVLRIQSVSLYPWLSNMQSACTILYCKCSHLM